MNATLGRVSLAAVVFLGMAGAALARDAGGHVKGFKGKGFAMPKYTADTRVSGPDLPYDWPVGDRYRPVSKPFYGRAY